MTGVAELLRKFPENLPRYTSYPPANHFQNGLDSALLDCFTADLLAARSVSVYIHIPFCDRLCWFCGCHTKHTLRYDPIRAYVKVLAQEIALWGKKLRTPLKVSRLHFGGGSPSLLQHDDLQELRGMLDRTFDFATDAEISFEIDPSDMKERTVDDLAAFGMTRASIGVQDFDPLVQKAINRPQSFEETARVVEMLRSAGITSLNIDALYGLPHQTEMRLQNTIRQVLSLQPDRVALFGYAHVPWLKPHQKMIKDSDLPNSEARLAQAMLASEQISSAGYQPIGIDHFALPHDSLAIAARSNSLHRNFQGYTDDLAEAMLPLGASSIGGSQQCFVQNEVATGLYSARISSGQLALQRGLARSLDDQIRGWIIERLMCNYAFGFSDLRAAFGADAEPHVQFARELAEREEDGMCQLQGDVFSVPSAVAPLVRVVASRFDQWLARAPQKYSKAV